MKNKIMNVIIALLVICFFIVSCGFRSIEDEFGRKDENMFGELVVNNQSSVNIKGIKYCNKELLFYGEGEFDGNSVLRIGRKISTELRDEETGYVFFKLLDEKSDVMTEVRTNEIFTVEKGKRVVLTITDNTLVVANGKNKPSTLLDLVTPAVLRIENGSSYVLYNLHYNGKDFGSRTSSGGVQIECNDNATRKFYNLSSYSGYVLFDSYESAVKEIKEEIKIEKGKMTTLVIRDDSYSVKMGSL